MQTVVPRAFTETMALAGRSLRHIPRSPEKLMDVTIQPVIFLCIFVFVFGSVISMPGGGSYREFLVAGMFAQAILGPLMGIAVGVADDMHTGIVERLRALPITRFSLLGGRAVSELAQSVLMLTVLTTVGLAVGWRPHGSVGETIGAYALLLLWAFAGIWIGTLLGLFARDGETAQQVGFTVMLPLMFLSAIFVPIGHLATPLRQFAEWNPLTSAAMATRTLFHNPSPYVGDAWPLLHPVLATVLWSCTLIGVFAPIAVWRYRRVAR
jgi:ABC-type polysaccharide/polyol phosphate export permease